MQLVFGLGPIGGNIGLNLVEHHQEVGGLDLSSERAHEWSAESGAPAWDDPAQVPWTTVDSVIIAVRTADQVASVLDTLHEHVGERDLTVLIVTTLTPHDAARLLSAGRESWQMYEAPVSGGPEGARTGSMTMLVFGPETTAEQNAFFDLIAGTVVHLHSAGHPSLVKLVNNTLGTYNLLALAHFLRIAEGEGMDPKALMEILAISSGNSWMREHFMDVAADLLVKDSHLLSTVIGDLPTFTVDDQTEETVRAARALFDPDQR
jgi:putative dehydrogenase